MNYLLDTNILIWWLTGDKKLKKNIFQIISDPVNVKIVSVISIWEIIIKNQTKKLNLAISLKEIFNKFGFEVLNINMDHVMFLSELPPIHKDPFDRMLISQAKVEGCILLTSDKIVKKYFRKQSLKN